MNNSNRTSYLAGSLGRALQKKINERIEELKKNLQINERAQKLQELKKLKISENEILCLELGGLCHDLGTLKLTYVYRIPPFLCHFYLSFLFSFTGHGPFSHLFDLMFYPRARERNSSKDLPEWTVNNV